MFELVSSAELEWARLAVCGQQPAQHDPYSVSPAGTRRCRLRHYLLLGLAHSWQGLVPLAPGRAGWADRVSLATNGALAYYRCQGR